MKINILLAIGLILACAGCATINQALLDKINSAINDYMAEVVNPPAEPDVPDTPPDQPPDEPPVVEPPSAPEGLPVNLPVPDNPSGTRKELWSFAKKTYDSTYRIRWPSYFANFMGIGKGSYTMVNGHKAAFRSFDTDAGAKRPSYTMPVRDLGSPVLCVLHDSQGAAIAWFQTPDAGTRNGRLP